jgi:hypothetical protein
VAGNGGRINLASRGLWAPWLLLWHPPALSQLWPCWILLLLRETGVVLHYSLWSSTSPIWNVLPPNVHIIHTLSLWFCLATPVHSKFSWFLCFKLHYVTPPSLFTLLRVINFLLYFVLSASLEFKILQNRLFIHEVFLT